MKEYLAKQLLESAADDEDDDDENDDDEDQQRARPLTHNAEQAALKQAFLQVPAA